jgi:hypothetical protein
MEQKKKKRVKTEIDILLETIVKNKRTAMGILKRKTLDNQKKKELEDFINLLNAKKEKIMLNKQKDKIDNLLETKSIFFSLNDASLHETKETKTQVDDLKQLVKSLKKENNQ